MFGALGFFGSVDDERNKPDMFGSQGFFGTGGGGSTLITLSADTIIALPTGTGALEYAITVQQNATGRFYLDFSSAIAWAGGINPVPPWFPLDSAAYVLQSPDGGATWTGTQTVAPISPIALDRFNRTNNAGSLGSAEIGGAWSATTGTWGIASNQSYLVTQAGDSQAVLDIGTAVQDITARLTVGAGTSEPGLIVRQADANNYLLAFLNQSQAVELYKRVAGGYTLLASVAHAVTAGVTYKMRIAINAGNVMTVYVDNTLMATVTDAAGAANTSCGLRHNDTSAARFDDLVVG